MALDLTLEEIRDRTASVIDHRRDTPFAVYAWGPDDPASSLARYVEGVVFGEAFGNTPAILHQEYAEYEASSLFLCVIDHRRSLPVGAARVILPSPAGFKSLNDVARDWGQSIDTVLERSHLAFDFDAVWDCATVGTLPDYRKGALFGLVSMGLYQAVSTAAIRCGSRWYVAIVDAPVLRVLQWRIGRPFERYVGVPDAPYLGSEASVPVWADLSGWEARLAATNPTMHQVVFGGEGLDGALAPPDWDEVTRLVAAISVPSGVRRS